MNHQEKAVYLNELGKAIFLLQLLAWIKLEDERKIYRKYYFTKAIEHMLPWDLVEGPMRDLSSKHRFLSVDPRLNGLLTLEDLKKCVEDAEAFRRNRVTYELVTRIIRGPLERSGGMSEDCQQLMLELGGDISEKKVLVMCTQGAELLCLEAVRRGSDVTVILSHPKLIDLLNFLLEKKILIYSEDNEETYLKVKGDTYSVLFADYSLDSDYYNSVFWAFEQLDANRKILFVPNTFLTPRRSETEDPILRRDILESRQLKAVITLPSDVLGAGQADSSLIAFDEHAKMSQVYFLDEAKSARSRKVRESGRDLGARLVKDLWPKRGEKRLQGNGRRISFNQCRDNNYNLSPDYYQRLEAEQSALTFLRSVETAPLRELADFYRPQSVQKFRLVGQGQKFREVTISDIGEDGIVRNPETEVELFPFAFHKRKSLGRNSTQFLGDKRLTLEPLDILLAIKGCIGRVALVPQDVPGNWFPNQSLLVIRLKNQDRLLSPIVLFQFFRSTLGQAQIKTRTETKRGSFFHFTDLKEMQIPVPSLRNQREIISRFKKIEKIYQRIEELKAETFRISGNAYELFK